MSAHHGVPCPLAPSNRSSKLARRVPARCRQRPTSPKWDGALRIRIVAAFLCLTISIHTHAAAFLFDATKAVMAGDADWVIDADLHNLKVSTAGDGPGVPDAGGTESNPQRIPSPPASGVTTNTAETYWDGALSAWAVDLVKLGHSVETLPYNGQITFEDPTNSQDLANYQAFVLLEPNILFTESEKAAIVNFVTHGGALLVVANHSGSDRNNDGADPVQVLNDLMTNSAAGNPFGILFNSDNVVIASTNVDTTPGNLITFGPAGTGTNFAYHNGATMTLDTNQNASVRAAVWSGLPNSTNNVMLAYADLGAGRVVAVGDSSPFDDGTGDLNDTLFNGYGEGSDRVFILNASLWLVGRPEILQSPQSVRAIARSNVTFTVAANGQQPLTFEWNSDAKSVGSYTITTSNTTSSLRLFNVSTNAQGSYYAVVTNAYGSVTSAVATLTVRTPPSVTLQPWNRTNFVGTTPLFLAEAAGDAPLTYQWRKGGGNLANQTNALLTLAAVRTNDMGAYDVVITNDYGSVTSKVAVLTVTTVPSPSGDALGVQGLRAASVGYVFGEVGFAFRPAVNISITNLGYAFSPDHLPAAYTVQVRDATGTVLASATLSATAPPANPFVFTNISPITVAADTINYLTCYDAVAFAGDGSKFWIGVIVDETFADDTRFVVAPELDYLGPTLNGTLTGGGVSPFILFVGPNFQFATLPTIRPSQLAITLTTSNTVVVRWPSSDTLGQLQSGDHPGIGMTNVTQPPTVIGASNVVELPASELKQLFRLIYP